MKTIEFRIPMPLTLEEYNRAQSFAFMEQSKRETGGGEGVQVLVDEPFKNVALINGTLYSGQYTHKIYHMESKVPVLARTILRPFIGDEGYEFHEEAWNSYPFCKTVITNPGYMKDNFKVVIETIHKENQRACKNESSLSPDTPCEVIDIFRDRCSFDEGLYKQAVKYKSLKSNRGPYSKIEDWTRNSNPVMICYKTISVHCKIFGLQNRLECMILDQYRQMLLGFHQQMWCWTDQWFDLSMTEIQKLEQETKEQLEAQINCNVKRGTVFT